MVGVCICEHHGRAGLADVCIHIHEAVLRDRERIASLQPASKWGTLVNSKMPKLFLRSPIVLRVLLSMVFRLAIASYQKQIGKSSVLEVSLQDSVMNA
jgi:hypothetical protein